ncbi:hypothetical protein FisN_8Hh123 [Fistulifera solaris]|uniref:CBM6 domain-containing protein n=1 Tax=Fistulifera solaris TaxID=1519565 RepID=A0A1Z5JXZ4_FISSO|nr:hypothetical protein FisN_8Hh123 [Fistulifera solaris]|eukprot:GAX18905.1 hypothetical protein FisN_8Hh123 [Fistulifera solaris]
MSQAGFVKAESIIAANEFCDMKGVELQNNPAGGQNIAFIDADDSMSYDVTVYHGDGYYSIVFQIASPDGDGSFQLLNYATGEIYLEMKDFPATGSWEVYESVRGSVVLPRGSLTLSLKATSGGWNYNGMKVSPQFTVGSTSTSTTDNSGSFFNPDDPTDTTAAESSANEDNDRAPTTDSATTESSGGSTWWDTVDSTPTDGTGEASWTTVANGAFHSVVMIEAGDFEVSGDIVTEPCSEGGENLSYIGNGDRLQFTADIPSTGVYEMSVRVASLAGDGSFLVIDSDSKALLGDLTNMPSTGWWQTWETVVVSSNVEMTRGQHDVTVLIPEGGFNIRWLHFELVQPIRGSTQSSTSNGRGRAPAAPTVILLQGDDLVDAQGVILQGDNGRTQTMAYLDAGDWLLFDVNPPVSGTYAIEVRLSSPSGDGSFILRDADTLQSYGGLSDLPSTGDWATARSARVSDINLQAGRVVPLEVLVNEGGWDLQWISLTLKES